MGDTVLLNSGDILICSSAILGIFFFFFSSRRRHTRLVSDWSSDVCSSDLRALLAGGGAVLQLQSEALHRCPQSTFWAWVIGVEMHQRMLPAPVKPWPSCRSEERRVGKEGRSRWSPYH